MNQIHQIKNCQLYRSFGELNLLINDIAIIVIEYAANYIEKYVGNGGTRMNLIVQQE